MDIHYTRWIYHGEHSNFDIGSNSHSNGGDIETEYHGTSNDDKEDDGIHEMLNDFKILRDNCMGSGSYGNVHSEVVGHSSISFDTLLREAQQELYPSCSKVTILSFIVMLLHLKVYNKWSNKSFDMLLELLKQVLSIGERLPESYYGAKNMLHDLGLRYIFIHSCKYDCALFWKDCEHHELCSWYGTSRWKTDYGKGKKIPHIILRCFLLKLKLQRLFISRKTTVEIMWHKNGRVDDQILRHPTDSQV